MARSRGTPKYRQIVQELRAWMESGEIGPGDKLPVETELAGKFRVSRQTVRQAVGELVREGLLERKQGSGTYVQFPRPQKGTEEAVQAGARIVGVVTTYISDYIFPHIIRGIEERLRSQDYSPLLFSTQNDQMKERQALESLLKSPAAAIIVEPTKSALPNPNLDLYSALKERRIPVVMMHAGYDEWDAPVVRIDDRVGVRLAVEHLARLGHRRLGALLKSDDKQGLYRLQGLLEGIVQDALSLDAGWLRFFGTETRESAVALYAQRLEKTGPAERPTAVFCYNDAIASDLIRHLRDFGIPVPEKISVVGFDDSSLAAAAYPMLTTVEHPKFAMGVKLADVILRMLEAGGDPAQAPDTHPRDDYVFVPRLRVRDSTAGPPAGA
jgi:GntR family transcriptional regulator of arabinose operon